MVFKILPVAVAFLRDGDMDVDEITPRIEDCGLTDLGRKGRTPAQTVKGILSRNSDIFIRTGRGRYALRNQKAAMEIPQAKEVIARLKQQEEGTEPPSYIQVLQQQIKELQQRNAALEERLRDIARLCELPNEPAT